jgi:putative membrane protein
VLTLPVTLVSLGLFILVINALLFWLVAHLVERLPCRRLLVGLLAAMLYSVISWALVYLTPE